MKVKLKGYAPDQDPTTEGIITNCQSIIPTLRGFKGSPAPVNLSIDALDAACQGGAVVRKLDDSSRLFAGTAEKLNELSSTTWTDRSKSGGYSLGTDIRWSFTQFGNVSLAAAKSEIIQGSTTGAFDDVDSSAPKASIVETVGQFVFAFDCNDQGGLVDSADSPNRWWCAAKGGYADWTPSVTNECATGLLTSAPGGIKAGKRFGENIIAYKERAMFIGVYGSIAIWDFREIPGQVGAVGQYAVADVGDPQNPKHIFMGADDFYQFDGSRPISIGNALSQTVYAELNRSFAHLSIALHDPTTFTVRFFYCSSSNTTPDKCVVFNYKTGQWGRDDRTIEMALQYISGGVTYDDLGSLYTSYNDLPAVSYDSSFWTARTPVPAIFDTSHILMSLNGPSVSSSITTGDMGDEESVYSLSRVSPRFLTKPSSANMVNYYRMALGDSLSTDQTTAMDSRSRFDVMRDANWHRFRFDFTGPVELAIFSADLEPGSEE